MGIINRNVNNMRQNMGLEMGMNHWEWEGTGLVKPCLLISTCQLRVKSEFTE